MFVHHQAKDRSLERQCLYCHADLTQRTWLSDHLDGFHYKTIICEGCGRENHVTVKFLGSGHDNWNRKEWLSLDELAALREDIQHLVDHFKLSRQ